MNEDFKKISIRGRLAFAVIALENAFKRENIRSWEVDFLLDKIWNFTSSMALDEWEQMINELMPVCVLDPNETFEEFTYVDFETILGIKKFYLQIPKYIVDIIDWTISIGTDNIYGGTGDFSPSSLRPLIEVVDLCKIHEVEIPSIEDFKTFSFSEEGGWGRIFYRKDLNNN